MPVHKAVLLQSYLNIVTGKQIFLIHIIKSLLLEIEPSLEIVFIFPVLHAAPLEENVTLHVLLTFWLQCSILFPLYW